MTRVGERFEFATATRIVFGRGALEQAGSLAKSLGKRALIVGGRSAARNEALLDRLKEQKIESFAFSIVGEPTTDAVRQGVKAARSADCDFVIGFGGGSAIDAAKAIGALLTNPGDLFDYLEVVGRGQPLPHPAAPIMAVPTTAGTGAEVTRNAVLAAPEARVKASLRGPSLLPRVALIDPSLTDRLPPELTATTGLDALTQLIEPYVCNRSNPLTDGFCREGLQMVARSLQRAHAGGANEMARDDMACASLLGGLALANAGLGAVHGFAAPIGGAFPVPHGAVCAALLAPVMECNVSALRERAPKSEPIARYQAIAALLTGQPGASIEDGLAWIRELCVALGIRGLRTFGLTTDAIPDLVEKAGRASSMKANPIALTQRELSDALGRAL